MYRILLRTGYGVVLCLSLSLIRGQISAQTPDIRTFSDYGKDADVLRLKYEYYYDFWSERNVRHGHCSEWAANGELTLDCWYTHGELDSTWRSFYGNGNPREFIDYRDGMRHGKQRIYDRKGHLIKEFTYDHGQRHGVALSYFPGGEVKTVSQYRSGKLQGNSTRYSRKGKVKSKKEFEAGEKVKKATDKETDVSVEKREKEEARKLRKEERAIERRMKKERRKEDRMQEEEVEEKEESAPAKQMKAEQ